MFAWQLAAMSPFGYDELRQQQENADEDAFMLPNRSQYQVCLRPLTGGKADEQDDCCKWFPASNLESKMVEFDKKNGLRCRAFLLICATGLRGTHLRKLII